MLAEIVWEDVWREHKRFIVAVAAGLVAFFGGLSTVWSIDESARRTARANRETEAEIRSLSEALSGREGFEAGVAVTLERTLAPDVRTAVEFQPRPAFALKEGDSPFIVYRQAIEAVEQARAEALRRNIACPEDLGFVRDPPEERVRVHIAGADLAERALSALVAVGARSIEAFRPGEADYVRLIEESDAPAARAEREARSAHPSAGGEGAGAERRGAPEQTPIARGLEDAPVLRRIPLRTAGLASVDALEMLLSSFQRRGSCLEVAGLKVSRAQEGLVRFELELSALTLVPAAEAKTAKGTAAGQRRAVPRAGGRLR